MRSTDAMEYRKVKDANGNGMKGSGSFSIGPKLGAALISAIIGGGMVATDKLTTPAVAGDAKVSEAVKASEEARKEAAAAVAKAASLETAIAGHATFDTQRDLDRRDRDNAQDKKIETLEEVARKTLEAVAGTNAKLERIAGQLEGRNGRGR